MARIKRTNGKVCRKHGLLIGCGCEGCVYVPSLPRLWKLSLNGFALKPLAIYDSGLDCYNRHHLCPNIPNIDGDYLIPPADLSTCAAYQAIVGCAYGGPRPNPNVGQPPVPGEAYYFVAYLSLHQGMTGDGLDYNGIRVQVFVVEYGDGPHFPSSLPLGLIGYGPARPPVMQSLAFDGWSEFPVDYDPGDPEFFDTPLLIINKADTYGQGCGPSDLPFTVYQPVPFGIAGATVTVTGIYDESAEPDEPIDRTSQMGCAIPNPPSCDDNDYTNPGGGTGPGTGTGGGGTSPGTDNGGGTNPGTGTNPGGGGTNPGTGTDPGGGGTGGTGDTGGNGSGSGTGYDCLNCGGTCCVSTTSSLQSHLTPSSTLLSPGYPAQALTSFFEALNTTAPMGARVTTDPDTGEEITDWYFIGPWSTPYSDSGYTNKLRLVGQCDKTVAIEFEQTDPGGGVRNYTINFVLGAVSQSDCATLSRYVEFYEGHFEVKGMLTVQIVGNNCCNQPGGNGCVKRPTSDPTGFCT